MALIFVVGIVTFFSSFMSKKGEYLAAPSDSHSNPNATTKLSSKRQEEPDKPEQSKQSKDPDTDGHQGQPSFVVSKGIMWQQTDGIADCAWIEAREYCEQLTLNGYDDWRLPSKDELASIVLDSNAARPFASERDYWTSTMTDSQKDAWLVRFPSGIIHHRPVEKPQGNARCVRITIN